MIERSLGLVIGVLLPPEYGGHSYIAVYAGNFI